MFLKEKSNLELLFDSLDEFDFNVRWSTVKLLNVLVLNLTHLMQDMILQMPRGCSRLIDLLNESREVIRNDAILLLINLTSEKAANANIQKIIAFESGFDRIIEIVESEEACGVVVEDCFNLLLNLLKSNHSNQNFFMEANYIKKIASFFNFENNSNTSLLLKIIRCLVNPANPQQQIVACQRAYNHFGLLHRLSAMLMAPGLSADLLGQIMYTVDQVVVEVVALQL